VKNLEILPAIDLKDGKAVRLTKGLMNTAKIYSDTPFEVAKHFESVGSKWVHIVDLNGAFAGEPKNIEQIKQIRENTKLKLELGGGIRNEDTIKRYLDIGIDRIILGSVATSNLQFALDMASKYPIAIGIDAKDSMVATHGWAKSSSLLASDFAKEFKGSKVEAIICTDISKDGTLSGINIGFTENIAQSSGILTIASGGLKDINDIKKAKNSAYIGGVIIGKAFYENNLNLRDILN
jgi:phosphoribosylformimino-5-aminoimidazole carboxamide ribotide isomerase